MLSKKMLPEFYWKHVATLHANWFCIFEQWFALKKVEKKWLIVFVVSCLRIFLRVELLAHYCYVLINCLLPCVVVDEVLKDFVLLVAQFYFIDNHSLDSLSDLPNSLPFVFFHNIETQILKITNNSRNLHLTFWNHVNIENILEAAHQIESYH